MRSSKLTHISLFTGIGGIDLAAEWAGFETVLMVENNDYCQKVLNKHWPDVPILEDIFNVNGETIRQTLADAESWQSWESETGNGREDIGGGSEEEIAADPAQQGRQAHEVQTGRAPIIVCPGESRRSGATFSPISIITGGFPCQPVSVAGQQRGKEDDRWLWPEMLRVIAEVRPRWVIAENVAGLFHMGLDDCLFDLEGEGYITETFLIPACAVDALHRRDRIFIVANTVRGREESRAGRRSSDKPGKTVDVADSTIRVRQPCGTRGDVRGFQDEDCRGIRGAGNWPVEPDVGRVAHGVPSRVDRLRALGNAVVPQQIYPILKAIADIENQECVDD